MKPKTGWALTLNIPVVPILDTQLSMYLLKSANSLSVGSKTGHHSI